MSEYRIDECDSCHAPIIWANTEAGKSMPVDPTPVDNGNVQLEDHGNVKPLARVLNAQQQFGKRGRLHLRHMKTCPDRDKWRRRGKT